MNTFLTIQSELSLGRSIKTKAIKSETSISLNERISRRGEREQMRGILYGYPTNWREDDSFMNSGKRVSRSSNPQIYFKAI